MPPNLAAHRAHARDFDLELPDDLTPLRQAAAGEDWGDNDAVLRRYVALQVPLAIEQGRFVWIGEHLVTRAGHLETDAGAPVYMGLARAGERWTISWAGPRPSSVEPLPAPELGTWPDLDPRLPVVVAMDRFPAPIPAGLPLITQNLIVAGAVEWSIRRGLAVRQIHGYFAPVHLTDREGAPEFAAAIQVQAERLVIRSLVEPREVYAQARAVARRLEELPGWLRDAL